MGLNQKSEARNSKQFGIFKILILISFVISIFGFEAFALDNPEQKATETIKNYIQAKYPNWSKAEIRLNFKSAESSFNEMKKLEDKTELKVMEVYPDFKPVGSVIFPLATGSAEGSRKFLLRVRVEVVKRIAAAGRLIKKGKMIEAADLKTEERDVALLPQKYFADPNALIGQEAKITIPQNSTLFDWMVGDVPLVHRGDPITLVVAGPALAVKTKAAAMEDGYLNSEVRVKRADSQKIVTGKLVSKNEVEIKL